MSEPLTFGGAVQGGRVIFDRPLDWTACLGRKEGKRVVVSLQNADLARRTHDANKRYWGFIVPLAGALLSTTRDVPLHRDQIHYILASAFGGVDFTAEVKGQTVMAPVRTSLMTTRQFYDYCTEIEAWLAEAGYHIPAPGERMVASL